MAYTAVSRCRINGRSFVSGDIIPPGIMLPYEAARLEKLGLIMQIDDPDQIKLYDDVDALSKESILSLIDIVGASATEAVKAVSALTESDIALITVLQRVDRRDKVITACKAKLEEFYSETEETE